MLRDRLNQNNKAGEQVRKRGSSALPDTRSPALASAKRMAEKNAKQPASRRARNTGSRSVSYAAQDMLAQSKGPRKSLPNMRSRVSAANIVESSSGSRQNTGALPDWRTRPSRPPRSVEHPSVPVQVISDEEQKKLAELEMKLPRVAGKIDSALLVVVLALLCIGLVMVYSASAFIAARYTNGDASYYFQKQLLGAVLGVVAMLVTMRVDYRVWRRFSLLGLAIALPLLIIVLFVGTSAYGASRWLTLGSVFSFQPSEFTKLALALYVADWLARKGNQVSTFLYGLAPFVILVGIFLGLVLLENDMGTALVIAGLATVMFFTAGANIMQFMLAMGCGGLVFLVQAFHGFRYYRLMGFLDPFKDVTTINLQLYQSLLALGSGGWLGLGLGASRQKTGYLPLPYIDSIFAIIGEELGFIGCAVIIILFLFLAFRGFRLARRTQDVYGALLATGITTWLVLQAIINIGSTTASIPYTGVPLPFISFGGTSLVVSLAAVGVLLNISRYIQEPEDPAISRYSITRTIKKKV